MKKAVKAKPVEGSANESEQIAAYSRAQTPAFRAVCERLRESIEKELPKATSKVWHGSPVWFLGDNPVVGYSANAKRVQLLFWNGQAFGEELAPVGKYRAAEAVFTDVAQIDASALRRWLKKAKADVFDSKTFFEKLRERRQRDA